MNLNLTCQGHACRCRVRPFRVKQINLKLNLMGHNNRPNLDFKERLWQAAEKLWGRTNAAGTKHLFLGLIYHKTCPHVFGGDTT